MKVFILASVDDKDLVFRVATEKMVLSPLFRRAGQAAYINGNPYSMYGKEASEWTGMARSGLQIVVLQVTSGPENALL